MVISILSIVTSHLRFSLLYAALHNIRCDATIVSLARNSRVSDALYFKLYILLRYMII